ncbi:MAG: hypothetical protein QNJ54_24970 [Prochloraceae cyanobacterium]|nr:hypothetical protein [Prochloraceae cyanobacterium]
MITSQAILKAHPQNSLATDLILEQAPLAAKLKERLDYLGVYYQRNPNSFYRHLSKEDKKDLDKQLKKEYSEILLNYFCHEAQIINHQIDLFVYKAFFADISPEHILALHIKLMEQLRQQLKLKGLSEKILLHYRLVLIDILAHLCEIYRRLLPREAREIPSSC